MRRFLLLACVAAATGSGVLTQRAFAQTESEPLVIPGPSGLPSGYGREGLPIPDTDVGSSLPKTAPDSEQLKSGFTPPERPPERPSASPPSRGEPPAPSGG